MSKAMSTPPDDFKDLIERLTEAEAESGYGDVCADAIAALTSLVQERDALRETNSTLNRRCQMLEAAQVDYRKVIALPPDGDGVRFCSGSLGRALAVSMCDRQEKELNAALSRCESLEQDAKECICKGNWRAIVKEDGPLLDRIFVDDKGDEYLFYGIIHGEDDYYYGMVGKAGRQLLSCVGSIEAHGFTLKDAALQERGG